MSEKKAFALRLSAEMMKEIERWAADEFRNAIGQIEHILRGGIKAKKKKSKNAK